MKLTSVLGQKRITLSFEVFPPKADLDFESVRQAAFQVAKLGPDYMSVTYGAGGSTRDNTLALAEDIQKEYGVTAIAHLTCVGATKDSIQEALRDMRHSGIENILALRGDRPQWMEQEPFTDYHYASDLVAAIKEFGGFCIGGACYPEGHPDAANKKEDILNLKKKVDAGCEFLTTQMFFDNNIYYNFMYKILKKNINVPIVAGIMPVTRGSQVKQIISLSGNMVPPRFKAIVDRFADHPEAMRQAGIAYATEQIIDLIANGVNHVHIYTMNRPDVAGAILYNLSAILK